LRNHIISRSGKVRATGSVKNGAAEFGQLRPKSPVSGTFDLDAAIKFSFLENLENLFYALQHPASHPDPDRVRPARGEYRSLLFGRPGRYRDLDEQYRAELGPVRVIEIERQNGDEPRRLRSAYPAKSVQRPSRCQPLSGVRRRTTFRVDWTGH